MALLTAQTVVKGGLAPTYSTPSSSDTITPVNGTVQFLHVKNASGSPVTVTLVDPGKTAFGSAATSPTVSVPATTGDRMIGPLPLNLADPSTGLITITYSATTSVTAALVQVPTV